MIYYIYVFITGGFTIKCRVTSQISRRGCAFKFTRDWKQKVVRNQQLCLSRAAQPLLTFALLPVSPSRPLPLCRRPPGLYRCVVQADCGTAVASEFCSQGLPFACQRTLSPISKSQFPRQEWPSLGCIPILGPSTVAGNSGYHTVQIYCTESALWMGGRYEE